MAQTDNYLLSWDCNGLEACVNLSEMERQQTWDLLKGSQPNGRNPTVNSIVNAITLRARYNSQRHYEIYVISIDESITRDDLVDMFDKNPQGMADLVRERGQQMYSDRYQDNPVIR